MVHDKVHDVVARIRPDDEDDDEDDSTLTHTKAGRAAFFLRFLNSRAIIVTIEPRSILKGARQWRCRDGPVARLL